MSYLCFTCILPLSYLDLTYVLSELIRENSGRKTSVLPCPCYEMQEKLPRATKGAAKGDSKVRLSIKEGLKVRMNNNVEHTDENEHNQKGFEYRKIEI